MVRFYYFINAGKVVDNSTTFYKVAIGSSSQCQRDFSFLVEFCRQHQCWLAQVSSDSKDFLARVALSISEDQQRNPLLGLPLVPIKIRDLVRFLKTGARVPCHLSSLLNRGRFRSLLDLNYRIFKSLSARSPLCLAKSRIKPEV